MTEEVTTTDDIYGGPTKRFFVSMLTRDIELADAILDLVDNCVDGAMRQRRGHLEEDAPYQGYHAHLTLNEKEFKITDNCGGIPDDFIEDAFSLGRPNIKKDGDLPTIGMYGIGMKRAIFKIGEEASVNSNSADGNFQVVYTSKWLDPDNPDWDLPIRKAAPSDGTQGVEISIPALKSHIAASFANDAFQSDIRRILAEHFGYIIQKGFQVRVNGDILKPKTLPLLVAKEAEGESIRAFDYEGEICGVGIKVTVGFFRGLATEADIDRELEGTNVHETAGISVVCNDRVILLNDRTMKTGWGDGGVPKYHSQFRSIAGLIIFKSNEADALPLSTTKNAVDTSSEVYYTARKHCMTGIKTFTDFTNKWKGMENEATPYFRIAEKTDVKTKVSLARALGAKVRGEENSVKFTPALPMPANKNPKRRISFVRTKDEVEAVSSHIFGEPDQEPRIVGEECFIRLLKEAKDER